MAGDGARIHLLGFMGAGKSSLGPVLAEKGGFDFVDLDALVQERRGMSIPDLFEAEGEDGFRRAEHEALASLADRAGLVLATGGGIVEREENHALLTAGFCVYLCWPWELLRDRLFWRAGDRPLVEEGGDALKERWLRRDPLYRRLADLVAELGLTELRTPRKIQFPNLADRVLAALREQT